MMGGCILQLLLNDPKVKQSFSMAGSGAAGVIKRSGL